MKKLAAKFTELKTSIGGNREKIAFEYTFGLPQEEQMRITRPSRANTRVISELEFAINLSEEQGGRFDREIDEALDYLLAQIHRQGVITDQDCERAEDILAPMEAAAKEYRLILAAHAHIDMNWMWSFNETVAVVLATFRSILNIMKQYPDFCYSQSQAAVYKIVEEYDPDLMKEIKQRIAEGRWEVTASGWVETDKNMPSGESLLRHIQYTREYLSSVWGAAHFDIDFLPDTFGHSANVPEIDSFGEVKYFYHCRGNAGTEVLYRYRAPSGKEVIAYREPNWYNGAVTPQMGAGLIEISRRSSGLKTGLAVYGVGDHGGGPTRRDVERAIEMMSWRIYPSIKFGTFREYFLEAESIEERLPVVDRELNYFAPGCYTTQSRIKRGSRRLEAALSDAEAMSALAGNKAGMRFEKGRMTKAWQDVLFTHFHDILTGSCVQDSREHAMGLFQTSMATANTQIQNAMRLIGEQIDTSSILVDIDAYNSQSEGAGAGYGIENFVGVPSTERGSGRTRIFHIFNTRTEARKEAAELTVWDWTGDMRLLQMKDYNGKELEFQRLDKEQQKYWDHRYFRVLADVTVPALGYTTVVLSQKEPERYPVYLQNQREQVSRFYDDYVLSNDQITVRISSESGRIISLRSNGDGEEMIAEGRSAGLGFVETETITSSAWEIGRYLKEIPVDRCIKVEKAAEGPLCQSIRATFRIASSTAEIVYSLARHQTTVQMEMKIDWHEIGNEIIPVLNYKVPLAYRTQEFRYDIPAGSIVRGPLSNDVPGLQYGIALRGKDGSENRPCAVLISDSKYGYRGREDGLALTLINSSTGPDPYPERGIHRICLWLGISSGDPAKTERMADRCNHRMFCQPSNCHHGSLPMEDSLLKTESDSAVISAVLPGEDGEIVIRGYETAGRTEEVTVHFCSKVASAKSVNLFGKETGAAPVVDGNTVTVKTEPYALFELKVRLQSL